MCWKTLYFLFGKSTTVILPHLWKGKLYLTKAQIDIPFGMTHVFASRTMLFNFFLTFKHFKYHKENQLYIFYSKKTNKHKKDRIEHISHILFGVPFYNS